MYLIKHQDMMVYICSSGGMNLRIFNLDSRWTWMVRCTSWPFCPRGKFSFRPVALFAQDKASWNSLTQMPRLPLKVTFQKTWKRTLKLQPAFVFSLAYPVIALAHVHWMWTPVWRAGVAQSVQGLEHRSWIADRGSFYLRYQDGRDLTLSSF